MKKDELETLLTRLEDDREQAGAQYNLLRRKLINYFHLIGHSAPEDGADQAFDRTAAKLTAGAPIDSVPKYLFGVAKMIGLEDQRKQRQQEQMRRELMFNRPSKPARDLKDEWMRRCLASLPNVECDFLTRYYAGSSAEERVRARLALAIELQTTLNALRLRAHRLRKQLRNCLRANQAR